MSYHDDEARSFSRNINHLQDRAQYDTHNEDREYDNSPAAIADEMKAIYADKKLDAAIDETFEKHHDNSLKNGVPSDVSLGSMGLWYDALLDPSKTAHTVAEMRNYAISAPPRLQEPPQKQMTEAELANEHMADMIKRVAIPEAQRLTELRESKQRAADSLKALKANHGKEAPEILNAMGNIWNVMLDDPGKNAPKVLHAAVAEQYRVAKNYIHESAVNEFAKEHPEIRNPQIAKGMSAYLESLPDKQVDADKALAAALYAANPGKYRNENDRMDDAESDVRNNPAFREYAFENQLKKRADW